ncbi:MAG: NlpC/P60 family protein [Paludibacteraceae bacterium]|jgi:hypothetical protein|nr:C40 family peptidase [Paludibacteraceae bacterium]MEE0911121.1 NlpC/P60 family protein [Paludibacteraceae bacterium]
MKVKLMIVSALLSCSTTFAATRLDVLNAKSQNINQMMVAILQQQQKPYAEGAKGEESFDATGLIVYAYKQVGLDVPYEKENLFKTGNKIKKPKNLEAGDIVFFHDGQNTKTATQVGIVQHIEKDGSFNFIYASPEKGVIVRNSSEEGFANNFMQGNRITSDSELNSIRNGYQKDVKAIEKAVEAEKATKAELERLQQELVQAENNVKILQTQLERNNNELIIIK